MNLVNVEIGTEAAQFPEKEYINGIFFAVYGTLMVWPGGHKEKSSVYLG
jgi:hypothetical protein